MTSGDGAPWYERAFRREYLAVYAHRDDESAERETVFVADALSLRADDRVLDAGCGAGRHARALASRGARVFGVDLSPDLLDAASSRGGDPSYVRADLRALPFRDGVFDHGVSLFTSFGYFDDAGNRTQLAAIRRVLRPGAGFVLDFLNETQLSGALVPASERTVAGMLVRERRRIHEDRGERRVEKDVQILVNDGGEVVDSWTESVRLYGRHDVEDLLRAASFAVRAVHGGLDGAGWTPESPRLVVHAEAL